MEKTLKVEGLSCSCCVNKVEDGVNTLSGITSVKVNTDQEEVQVVFDTETVTLEQIKDKIVEQGYQVV